jgi:predicted acylesterase/phospholipase RssA
VCILNVTRYHVTKGRDPCSSFFVSKPRSPSDHRRLKGFFHEPKDRSDGGIFPRTRILSRVQPHCQNDGHRTHKDRFTRDYHSLYLTKPWSLTHTSPQIGGCLRIRSDEYRIRAHTRCRVRFGICDITSPISSVLLNRKMKYLILGPASMGIFSLIGVLKARESELVGVKEISGSSAGSILALFMGVGMSVDEILETSLNLDVPNFVKIRIGSFFNKFGFVDMAPIRKKLVEICGCDPTFKEIDMKIYISAFCMNTSETVYFSKDTHPDMNIIDAVCMSMAIPFIFACGKYNGETYVDGGMKEEYPLTPFFDKKPYEVTCIKIKMNRIYQEDIQTPKQFVECLVRSALSNRVTYDLPIEMHEINVEDTDVFDFSMSYEEKVQLFNRGYMSH